MVKNEGNIKLDGREHEKSGTEILVAAVAVMVARKLWSSTAAPTNASLWRVGSLCHEIQCLHGIY